MVLPSIEFICNQCGRSSSMSIVIGTIPLHILLSLFARNSFENFVQGKTESDEEFEILDVRGMARNSKNNDNWIEKYFGEITKASTAKQVAVGGLSGWVAGFVFTKVGRVAAASVGGSLLLLQLASHQGYIRVNWSKVNHEVAKAKRELEKRASKKLPWILEEAEDFLKDNIFLATGFAGGFLIGMASS